MSFDCWEHFNEWEGWTCKLCGDLIESSEKELIFHLKEKHDIGVED